MKKRRNKLKYLQLFPTGGDFFLKKIVDISLPVDISPIFGEIYEYFFRQHFTPLFCFTDTRNKKFQRNFDEKTDIFNHACMFPTNNMKNINSKNSNDNSSLLHKKETKLVSINIRKYKSQKLINEVQELGQLLVDF